MSFNIQNSQPFFKPQGSQSSFNNTKAQTSSNTRKPKASQLSTVIRSSSKPTGPARSNTASSSSSVSSSASFHSIPLTPPPMRSSSRGSGYSVSGPRGSWSSDPRKPPHTVSKRDSMASIASIASTISIDRGEIPSRASLLTSTVSNNFLYGSRAQVKQDVFEGRCQHHAYYLSLLAKELKDCRQMLANAYLPKRNFQYLGAMASRKVDGNFLPRPGLDIDYSMPVAFAQQVEQAILRCEIVHRYDLYVRDTLKRPALLLDKLAEIDAEAGYGHDASEQPDYKEWSILTQFCKVELGHILDEVRREHDLEGRLSSAEYYTLNVPAHFKV